MERRLLAIVAASFLIPPAIAAGPESAALVVLASALVGASIIAFRRRSHPTTLTEIGRSLEVKRECTAFGVAPLAVPVIGALYFEAGSWAAGNPALLINPIIVAVLWTMALIGYVGTIAFGPPIYRFLLGRGLTAFWIAPPAGFVTGCIITYLSDFLLYLITGAGTTSYRGIGSVDTTVLLLCGVCGGAVGTFVWLIARPDRQSQ